MLRVAAAAFVFLGGFAVMVLEIIGARYLAKDFGGSFYVWISQIGVILIALALGYAVGGAMADRFRRATFLALPLGAAGLATLLIPAFTPPLLEAIVSRHPADQGIPLVWQKLDPVLGSWAPAHTGVLDADTERELAYSFSYESWAELPDGALDGSAVGP